MINSIIEIAIIAGIIGFQLVMFLRTRSTIKSLQNLFQNLQGIQVLEAGIPPIWLKETNDPNAIIQRIQKGEDQKEQGSSFGRLANAFKVTQKVNISLLQVVHPISDELAHLVNSINKYLLKNRDGATDFKLMQDLTERSNEAIEDSIESTISVPLYLGLLGTMFGIIYGLFQINVLGEFSETEIQTLLSGVKVAMIASFAGLLMTIINSGFTYKKAKVINNRLKGDFYSFLQTELMPIASKDLSTVLYVMQQNLEEFNDAFRGNITAFEKTMDSIHKNTEVQRDFLKTLEKIGFQNVINSNVAAFNNMSNISEEFSKLGEYFGSINQTLATTSELTDKLNYLSKVADQIGVGIHKMSVDINARLDDSKEVMSFLKQHFSELEGRKTLVAQAVIDLDNFLQKTFRELEQNTQLRAQAIRDVTMQEEDLLIKTFEKNRNALANLQKLEELVTIRDELLALSESIGKETGHISQGVRSANTKLSSVNQNLETLRITAQKGEGAEGSWLKRLFKG